MFGNTKKIEELKKLVNKLYERIITTEHDSNRIVTETMHNTNDITQIKIDNNNTNKSIDATNKEIERHNNSHVDLLKALDRHEIMINKLQIDVESLKPEEVTEEPVKTLTCKDCGHSTTFQENRDFGVYCNKFNTYFATSSSCNSAISPDN